MARPWFQILVFAWSAGIICCRVLCSATGSLWSILPLFFVVQHRQPWDVKLDSKRNAMNALNIATQIPSQWIIQKNLTPCESSCPKICALPLLTSTFRAFCNRS